MIVPQHWAESRLQHRDKERQVTVRRFGWSDVSPAEAQANADVRAQEALQRVLAGEGLHRRDPKVPYNGAEGVPIREEIVSRHGDTIVTRNSYGARCLNTPDVLFVDVDFPNEGSCRLILAVLGFLELGAVAAGWSAGSVRLGMVLCVSGLFLARPISQVLHWALVEASGGAELVARRRIDRFLTGRPAWNFRLYRTPAGLRLLATHQTFRPDDPEVSECFRALGTDRLFALMCRKQQCFRARVSAKPWRIGIAGHLKPRPGVWPIAPERLPERNAWIEQYERAARSYAACEFLESVGSCVMHPAVRCVQELHDELSGATRGLPIA